MKVTILKAMKRREVFKEVFKRMQKNEFVRKQVLIVPEKFGLNAEKALFEELDCQSTFFMDVTTFDRMADDYVVLQNKQFLSKSAGVMLVQKIAQDNLKEMKVLNRSCQYNGFCENVFNTIMLLKSSHVSPVKLENALENLMDISKLKISDLKTIYEQYEKSLQERFVDSANKMDKLAEEIAFDDSLKDIDFFVYAPKLTKQILSVLQKLCKQSHSLTMILDDYEFDSTVFDDNEKELISMFRNEGIDFDQECVGQNMLATQLKSYATGKKFFSDNLSFYAYKSLEDEVSNVANKILNSERFKDNAILVCGLEQYKATIEKKFQELEIAYFLDEQVTLLETSPTKFLLDFVNLTFEFKIEKLLNVVKSNFLNFEQDKVFNYELYLKKWGLNEQNYFNDNKPDDELFADFNEIYVKFNEIFQPFKKKMSKSETYSLKIQATIELLEQLNIDEKIVKLCEKLTCLGQLQTAKQLEQVVNKWQNLFSQLENILGLNKTTTKDFFIVLKAGFNSVAVKTPPLVVDCVYICELENAMLYEHKNLFVMGAIENSFPTYNNDCGLILDAELEKMSPVASIEPSVRKVNRENVCNIFNNLCSCENLTISYPLSIFFSEQKPSSLLLGLKKQFNAQFLQKKDLSLLDNAKDYANYVSKSKCAECILRQNQLLNNYASNLENRRAYSISKKLGINLKQKQILPNIQRILTKSSVSQLQTYFDCPYKNFVKYGLNLKENPDNSLKAVDIGTFMHKVAELFGKFLKKNELGFVDDESVFEDVCKKTMKLFEYDDNGKKSKIIDSRQKAILNNLLCSAKQMLRAINEQLKRSEFKIADVEKNIVFEIDNGKFKTQIVGKVDRVDTFDDYVRIIDYKTGSEDFNLEDLKKGRRIQLFIYLGALQKLENKIPIGTYYFKINDDFLKPTSDKELLKNYCLNGVTINDPEIVALQDKTLCEENLVSDIIPVTLTKSGAINKKRKGAVERDELQEMINYAEAVFKNGILEIAEGNIAQSPYEDACKYCEFKGVLCYGTKYNRK